MTENQNSAFFLILIIIALFIFITVFSICSLKPFLEMRNYIKMEMSRSGSEKEYNHWKRKLKRHYVLQIPIIGKYIVKHIK